MRRITRQRRKRAKRARMVLCLTLLACLLLVLVVAQPWQGGAPEAPPLALALVNANWGV